MVSPMIKLSVVLMLVGVCLADTTLHKTCLECICQASTGCRLETCNGDACGLFKITWAYWADAGKPTLSGVSSDAPDAYSSCTNDPYCAAETVQRYMTRYGQDCNGDGVVNCHDYMAIHRLGPLGCKGNLPFEYVNAFNQCLATVAQIRQG